MRKMSARFSEKYLSENKNLFVLPPSVKGKLYGFCTLTLKEINWTTTKKYNLVDLKIKWWGETQVKTFEGIKSSAGNLKISTNRPLLSVCYQINTNFKLFQSYLNNCEPLVIEIFSSKTCDLIGSVSISFSKIQNTLEESSNYKFTSNIVSSRDFKLGTINISLDINMHRSKDQNNLHSIKTTSEKEDISNKQLKTKTQNETNKENIKVNGQKKVITFRDQKPVKASTLKHKTSSSRRSSVSSKSTFTTNTSSISEKEIYSLANRVPLKSSMINYLSGHSMSEKEEDRILKEIIQASPSHSVIEEIDNIDYSLIQKTKKINDMETIQIHLFNLELNNTGFNEVVNYCKKMPNTQFIVKCAVTSKLLKAKDLNFISPVFITPYKKTVFNKQLVQRVHQIDHENAANKCINFGFCIKSIEINNSLPHLIGFTRVNIADIIENKMKYTKKCAIIDEHNVIMGAIAVNIQIGKKISFEINNPEDYYISNTNNNCNEKQSHSSKIFKQILKTKSNPITSNEHDCDNHSERQYDNKNMQTDPVESTSKMSQKESTSFNDHRDTEMIDVEIKENRKKSKIYHGLLFIESLKSIKDHHASEYFITYEGFWNDCRESTELSINCILNYLKQFPVICDDEFLKRVQNNYLELKLWEKTNETSEKLIGTTKVSLHQFYIAFKEPEMIEHLSFNKLPVISMDAWCNFISPLSNELFCQGKILLAIGSENQIDYLKLSRNLHNLPPLQRINYPQNEERFNVTSNLNVDPNAQIKSKLTAFIESLSQKLPEPNIVNSFQSKQQSLTSSSSSSSSSVIHNSKSQLRKTSDLLDSLQKALQQPLPMSSNNNEAFPLFSEKPVSELTFNQSQLLDDCIKMKVNIEQATNLPKLIVKKCRNKRRNKSTPPQRLEYEPHTFATFEAATDHLNEKFLPSNTIKSHEGIVYCTSVINSCNPEWNENFEVFIKFDILKNPQKKFVVKIWRKASHNPTKIEAAPFEDSVIGFTAIDLSVLLTGLPVLSGFYNIIDFSGRCNGQLKITLKPLDDVSKFRNPESPLVPLMCPLSIDINSSESSNDGSNVLSRTLKRKFTELDEITQRLRARLFDVTGDDPDDEFERDLNTAVTEDEIDNENFNKDDFGWLKQDDNTNVLMNKEKSIEMELNKTSEFQEQSSSKNSSALTRRETVTGCSSSDENTQKHSLFPIDDLFKKYDLDTLINPNIFKNLLDPNCNSDSTPTLVSKTADCNIDLKADNESDVTTISSISNDQIQTIQKALQKTSLHEQQNNSRNDPDGHNNISD